MTYLKACTSLLLLNLAACQFISPKVEVIKNKDITTYGKIGTSPNDCLSMNAAACKLFNRINGHRSSRGLKPLLAIENCNSAAQAHSENMYAQEELSHNLKGSLWIDRIKTHNATGELMAENVAMASTPERAFTKWLESKSHKNNLENPQFTHTGMGNKGRYWTQCFLKAVIN